MSYQPFDLTGQAALVTGGNGGIGYGMAEALLQAGASVAIWGHRAEKTEHAQAQLAQACGDAARVHAFTCDVGDEPAVEDTFERTLQALGGRLDACFANAGVSGFNTPLLDTSLAEWRRIQRVNVEGVFLTFRAAARHMKASGHGGSLVATASTAALEGAMRNSAYGASKGAVTSFVRALAVELARYGIRVNSILPGWIASEMTQHAILENQRFADAVLPRIPQRRWGQKEDFGGIAVYLASPASGYTTGEQFVIDGGYTKF